jgi:hypothetical protein
VPQLPDVPAEFLVPLLLERINELELELAKAHAHLQHMDPLVTSLRKENAALKGEPDPYLPKEPPTNDDPHTLVLPCSDDDAGTDDDVHPAA